MEIKLLLIIPALLIVFSGCTTTSPSLQNVDFDGEAHKNTIKITKDEKGGDLTLRGSIALNGKEKLSSQVDGHSKVNANGIFEVEPVEGEDYYIERSGVNVYEFDGNNFHWTLPEIQSMIELEYNLSSSTAIYGGASYTSAGEQDLFSYNCGIGFFKERNTWAVRFDVTGKYHETFVDIDYVEIENVDLASHESRKVYFYSADGKDSFFNMNLAFTLNTRRSDWPLNLFLNYTLGWQRFYSIELPEYYVSLEKFEYSSNYNSFSAGIFRDIENLGRLICGARYTYYVTEDEGDLSTPDYFVQFDFNLF